MNHPLSLADRLAVVPVYCEILGIGQFGYHLGRSIKHIVWDHNFSSSRESDMQGMKNGFLHVIPIVGEIYSIYQCIENNDFAHEFEIGALPVAQQVQGICYVLFYGGHLILNLFKKTILFFLDQENLNKANRCTSYGESNDATLRFKRIEKLQQMNWKESLEGFGKGVFWIVPGAGTGCFIGMKIAEYLNRDGRKIIERQRRLEQEYVKLCAKYHQHPTESKERVQ